MRTALDPTTRPPARTPTGVAAGRPPARATTVRTEHRPPGAAIDVRSVTQTTQGRTTLHDVSFRVAPGDVVAIVGGSGAGKTTLLETMAGLRVPAGGQVAITGAGDAPGVGYVPQDDIIHRDLPLARTLRYAAELRLPAGTPREVVDRTVDETLAALDLGDRASVRVGSLSGGQRKRASIAVEMLTHPRVFFLDEPTSGLDPATAREVLRLLRRLARAGVTTVLTTHSPSDIDLCDRIVFLARDGHLAFEGTPDEARRHFGSRDLTVAYERLAVEDTPAVWARRFAESRPPVDPPARGRGGPAVGRGPGPLRQWAVLTRRSADLLVRNRLTLAVLVGSPALVTAMMAVLFRPGAFDAAASGPDEATQAVFWLAFAGFFFGLTYGLLQIVGEMAILRRERLAGVHLAAYVGAKVTVLTPILAAVAGGMLAVLRALDRLPAAGGGVHAALLVTLTLEALAALALGLLASAAVTDAAQATLALPMLCFPQVLFAGAIVPVADMALPGRVMSHGLANRWAFESLGRALDLDRLATSLAASPHQSTFTGSPVQGWAILAAFAGVLLVATAAVLHRRAPGAATGG
ncbi:MAG: ATP-binding cassette domain-containing protein [Acidimicrobiia bacterium]